MTAAQTAEATPSLADIIQELEEADDRPDNALRIAVLYAADIAPRVIDVIEQAADGTDLVPAQENLLSWGIHVLAAGRRKELFLPLLRLVSQSSKDTLRGLIGSAITESLARIVISVFPGTAAPLVDACADTKISSLVRWSLIVALARLTFDGAIDRQTTWDFLDRFERQPLAEPGDQTWEGWQDAICLLGLEDMRERMHAAWRDGRIPRNDEDRQYFDEQLTVARNLAAGDAGLFVRAKLVPIDDPVEALSWLDNEVDSWDDLFEDEGDLFDSDPLPSHSVQMRSTGLSRTL
jgi:uncharacterized protein